jgi:signal transduction histidine kinase
MDADRPSGEPDAAECQRLRQELERSRARLAEGELRFLNIIERTADGIVIVDQEGRVRFANRGAERMFSRSAAELVGHDFGIPVVSGEMMEMDIVRPGGAEPIVAELSVSATTWDGVAAQIISLRDMTDRKRAEERAQRLLLEQSAREQAEKEAGRARFLADASAALDASLNAERTLASLAKMIVPRLADWCLIDLLEEKGVRRVAAVHADPLKQELLLSRLGTRSSMTVPLDARDSRLGTITFVCGDRDFDDSDLALAQEIGSRAARALDNARLFEAALMANRVKSDFLAVMSHELRTPLNAILGYAELLLEGVAGEMAAKQTHYLDRLRAGGTQLLQIVHEILMYAEMEAGRAQALPRHATIGELMDEVVAIVEPLAREKALDLRLELEEREETIYLDVGKLRQITLNLMTNAVKFTDAGAVGLSVGLRGDELVIAVTDTGIGIVPGELEEIFEPFRQLEQGKTRRAGGTGLGLSVSRQLAALLGGELSVESRADQGSTFTLRVPSGRSAAVPAPGAEWSNAE